MKKLLYLFIAVATLVSCSDDDSSDDGNNNSIEGTWFLFGARSGGVTTPFPECNQQTNITFMANGDADSEYYEEVAGSCTMTMEDSGDWSTDGNGSYTFSVPGYGEYTGSIQFESGGRFVFTSPQLSPIQLVFEKP